MACGNHTPGIKTRLPQAFMHKMALAAVLTAAAGFTLLALLKPRSSQGGREVEAGVVEYAELVVVYDNRVLAGGAKGAWGFSCLVDAGGVRVLFDAGGSSAILLHNMRTLGVSPRVDVVVISHEHGDHIGGLWRVLELNPGVSVYVPAGFPGDLERRIRELGCNVIECAEPTLVCRGVVTTGTLGGFIREHALVVATRRGIVVVTGCAHPGVAELVEAAERATGARRVALLIGGFHLMGASRSELEAVAERLIELGVEEVAPCHCSGERAVEVFREHFGGKLIECGVGLVIRV